MKKLWIFLCIFGVLGYGIFAMTPKDQKVIIMLGAPGAGKGTQAVRLSQKHGLPQISTGDLFRDNLKNETPIGKKAKAFMDRGDLVPDEVVLEMLFQRISQSDCAKGYILDGFPRTIPQAEAYDARLGKHVQVKALSLEVPDEVIVERLSGRLVCKACGAPYHEAAAPPRQAGVCDRCGGELMKREDDNPDVVRKRLMVYHEQTEPLKRYYREKGMLELVDGSLSKESTVKEVDHTLASFLK